MVIELQSFISGLAILTLCWRKNFEGWLSSHLMAVLQSNANVSSLPPKKASDGDEVQLILLCDFGERGLFYFILRLRLRVLFCSR